MAFSKDKNTTVTDRAPAAAWINISVPLTKGADGKERSQQLVGIPLNADDPIHAGLIARREEMGEKKFVAALMKNLIVTYNVPGSNGEKAIAF